MDETARAIPGFERGVSLVRREKINSSKYSPRMVKHVKNDSSFAYGSVRLQSHPPFNERPDPTY